MFLKLKSKILILICLILKSTLGLDLLSWPLLFWNKPLEQMTLFSREPRWAWFSSKCFLSLVCTAQGLGGTPVTWGSSSSHWESPPLPLNGAGECVSRTPLFDSLGKIFKPIRKQKEWCKKNLTHRPPSKTAPLKPLSPKHFKASPILAFRPVYPHSGWGPAHTKFVFGFPQWFQTCLLLVVYGDWASSRSGLPGLGESSVALPLCEPLACGHVQVMS